MRDLRVGDRVEKVSGDYEFVGFIVAKFNKRNGLIRFVVENDQGILHIFSEKNLSKV